MVDDYSKKAPKYRTAKEFIEYLHHLPDVDLKNPKTIRDFQSRIGRQLKKEFEEQDRIWKKSAGRAFTKVIK